MEQRRNYSIRKNRYKNALISGFFLTGDSKVECNADMYEHYIILGKIDGIEDDALWGQLHFDCDFDKDTIYTVYICASNYEEFNRRGVPTNIEEFLLGEDEWQTKKKFYELVGGKKVVNQSDILLYDVKGRYLYVMLEVSGNSEGCIENMYINSQGDFFMETLPEVYHEYGGFYHRYLSIFSTIFMGLQYKIENAHDVFDIDKAPAEVLTLFGKWMGVDVSGNFLSEDKLRTIIKEAYTLNRMKGTRKALERLTEIVLGEKAIILEKNCLHNDASGESSYEALYGRGMNDVTMLIKTHVPENQKSQLLFLIKQFVPVRCNLNIRFLDESSGLDDHLYLDMNTQVSEMKAGELDTRQSMDGRALLQE